MNYMNINHQQSNIPQFHTPSSSTRHTEPDDDDNFSQLDSELEWN